MALVIYCNLFGRIDLDALKLAMILFVFDHLVITIKSIMVSNKEYIDGVS